MANDYNGKCPACGSAMVQRQFNAEDFTVSHEVFEIWQCSECFLRFTLPVPDLAAIGRYYRAETYISHTDTREGIVNRLYHVVRKRTLKGKRRLVTAVTGKATGTLLEIGAGTGAFAHAMRDAGWKVTGLEPDEGARQKAAVLYNLELQSPGELFTLPASAYDAITLWHVLEHVHDVHGYLQQMKRLLKPGGRVFIAVPNYASFDARMYRQHWAAYDVPRHLYHFSPRAMEQLLRTEGLTVHGLRPMWFDSFYVAMLSEQHKTGRNNLLKAGMIGLLSNLLAFFNKRSCSSVVYIAG